jgi:hypothetical protein
MRIAVTPTKACSDIDKAFATIFHDSNGDIKSRVCLICNRHVYPEKFRWLSRAVLIKRKLLLRQIHATPDNLTKCYHYRGEGYQSEMENLVLAPQGCYDIDSESFLVCMDCHKDLYTNQQRPYFSLANNFAFGEAQ